MLLFHRNRTSKCISYAFQYSQSGWIRVVKEIKFLLENPADILQSAKLLAWLCFIPGWQRASSALLMSSVVPHSEWYCLTCT